jgi:anti-sigma regulatory factor (Ser/Thr protein kinase)
MLGEVTVTLPPDDRAPAAARRALDGLSGVIEPGLIPDLQLLVTELVTNGVLHGDGDVRLKLVLSDTALHVEVIDDGDGLADAVPDPDRDGGWGLLIVDQLADRWGVFAGSTHVWAQIDRI